MRNIPYNPTEIKNKQIPAILLCFHFILATRESRVQIQESKIWIFFLCFHVRLFVTQLWDEASITSLFLTAQLDSRENVDQKYHCRYNNNILNSYEISILFFKGKFILFQPKNLAFQFKIQRGFSHETTFARQSANCELLLHQETF